MDETSYEGKEYSKHQERIKRPESIVDIRFIFLEFYQA